MNHAAIASSPLGPALAVASARAGTRTRRLLLGALALSLSVHLALTFWPTETPSAPEATPLAVVITQLPPPPKPSVVAAKPPAPKPRRVQPRPPPAPAETAPVEIAPEAVEPTPDLGPAPDPIVAQAEAEPTIDAAEAQTQFVPGAATSGKTLPPRVDLAYQVFYGTQGFLIGEAVYRFEHADNRYRIATLGEARGLAALVLRGQGKIESRGLITEEGLQPQLFRVERGGPDRVETAEFDWEAGIVTMHENRIAALDFPTFDPLALMWQYYFTPPTGDQISVTVATPRRIYRYTMTRESSEVIELPQGPVDAERWHRRSEDGKTDAYVWLAPLLRHIPVKMRVSHTYRGTIEVLLAAIRVDETAAEIGSDLPSFADVPDTASESPRNAGLMDSYEMTGQ